MIANRFSRHLVLSQLQLRERCDKTQTLSFSRNPGFLSSISFHAGHAMTHRKDKKGVSDFGKDSFYVMALKDLALII